MNLILALRPTHWLKNGFVFLPLLFGRKLFTAPDNLRTAAAFVLFCGISSAIYLINDLLDFNQDIHHPTKRLRPIAAGKIARPTALGLAICLSATALVGAFLMDSLLGWMLLIYFLGNFAYSIYLKTLVIIDIFCLGGFFALRLLSGTFAARVSLSPWIILMGVVLALFLGFNKRRQELILLGQDSSRHRPVLTKYNLYFIDQMVAVITSSTVIFYTLYTCDDRTVSEVGDYRMMLTIPFVLYGIFRYLYLLHRRKTDGDPTRILISDFPMQLTVAFWIITAVVLVYLIP